MAANVATLVSLLSLTPPVVSLVVWARGRPVPARLPVERAADELAEQLRQLWEKAATERGLWSAAIDLRWQWSHRQVTGPVTQAVAGAVGTRFAPLPGMAAVTVEQLRSGFLGELHPVYGGLDSGRLVILGAPGAGKSGAGIRLLLDALTHRSSVKTIKDRARVPVPVLLSVHGWDPGGGQSFKDWLALRLLRDNDFDFLRSPAYGRDTVVRLIEGGYLAVILDGLDEMPEPLRQVALRALDEQATFRLVVLTRSDELVKAVSGGRHLQGAAALELCPVEPQQAAEYLESRQVSPLPLPWQQVVDHLKEHPQSALAQALDTPLMLTLLLDIYCPGDEVDELTKSDSDQFATRKAVENHLLARTLPAAYAPREGRPPSPYTVDQAQKWLGHLARNMNAEGTRDLAWWQVPDRVSVWPRALFTVCLLFFAYPFASGLGNGFLGQFGATVGLPERIIAGFGSGLIYGFQFALLIGIGYGLVSMTDKKSNSQPSRIRWLGAVSRMHLIGGFAIAFTDGIAPLHLIFKFASGNFGIESFGIEFPGGLRGGLIRWFGEWFTDGLVIGLGFALVAGLQGPWGTVNNRTRVPAGLWFGLFVGLMVGLLRGLEYALISSPAAGLVGGLYKGLFVGLGYGFVVGLRGRLPWQPGRWNNTDQRTVLIVALVICLSIGFTTGLVFLFVVGLGGRLPRQLSRPRWSKADLRTDLIAGLGAGLVTGLIEGGPPLVLAGVRMFGHGHGLHGALIVGLGIGLLTTLLVSLGRSSPDATRPVGPRSLWRRELGVGIGLALVIGVGFGVLVWRVNGPVNGLGIGLQVGLGAGLMSSATWTTALVIAQLWRRGQAPVRLVRFLDDARIRNVLRTVGPVYQFRHARLQDWLAETSRSAPPPLTGARLDSSSHAPAE